MVIQKMKRLSGFILMMAAVPAAIFLAPRIGLWTIALVLGSGALGGWLTLGPTRPMAPSLPNYRKTEDVPELSIYEDPNYATVPGNYYNVDGVHISDD